MPKKKPFAKGRRVCLFCGGASGARSSGEHIWPKWAGPLLPVRATKHEYSMKGQNGFKEITEIKKDYKRQGSPSTIEIRGPCKKCNETWMSQIETAAKSILTEFAQGSETTINRKQAKTLAEWAFIKFCVCVCGDNEILWCVSEQDRHQFMETRAISKSFSAWLFRHNVENWFDRGLRFGTRIYDVDADFRPAMNAPYNANTLALGFGKALFLFVFQWGIKIDTGFSRKHATKLWPMRASGGLRLPDIELTENEIFDVARLLPNIEVSID